VALCGETTLWESLLLPSSSSVSTGRFDKVSAQKRRRRGQAKRSHAAELLDMTGIPLIEIRSERIPRRMASLDWPHV
jgi:hypothetical protein